MWKHEKVADADISKIEVKMSLSQVISKNRYYSKALNKGIVPSEWKDVINTT